MINISSESGKLFIGPSFCDPVALKNPEMDEPKIRQQNKSLMGYFGYLRDLGLRIHTGYDYVSAEGGGVLAVHDGEIVQVRIGVKDGKCEQKSLFDQNHSISFSSDTCENCKNHHSCFGIQLWLRIKLLGSSFSIEPNKPLIQESEYYLYAFYAHLSKIDDIVLSAINPDNIKNNNTTNTTLFFNNPPMVYNGQMIGKSGCTGNAYNMTGDDQHLHFECRKEIESPLGFGTRISPNTIVKTQFFIVKNDDQSSCTNKVTNNILNGFLDQEKALGQFDEAGWYNSWIKHTNEIKNTSRFQEYCKNKARENYNTKKTKKKFDEEWPLIKKDKWKNFRFTNKDLALEEKGIWEQFKNEEYPRFICWMEFQTKHKIIAKKTDMGIIRL